MDNPSKPFGFAVVLGEVFLIFTLMILYGAYPLPDVNEQYYVGKAIHFWQPDYFASDAFLDSANSHWLFFVVFGFFGQFMPPVVLVWFGRLTSWFLMAFGWQRLSSTLIPKRGASILTAALFLFLVEHFHMAGEWVVGGIEGKEFAFPFVFLGLAAALQGKTNKAFVYLGIASAFHVLVGGWVVLALMLAYLPWHFRERRAYLPGLITGGIISLLGLIPALALDAGTSTDIIRQAHEIYVFQRLPHHLVVSSLPWNFQIRFLLLLLVWFLICRPEIQTENPSDPWRIWQRLTLAAILIAFIGVGIDYGSLIAHWSGWWGDRSLTAEFLRFYWFRLSDWLIPAAVALGGTAVLFRFCEDSSNRLLNYSLLGNLFMVAIVFTLLKFGVRHVSELIAAKATTDPLWPVAPRPTDGLAFLLTLLFFAILERFAIAEHKRSIKIVITAILVASAGWGVISMLQFKTERVLPRSAPPKASIADGWLDVCKWIRENTDPEAVFLAPKGCDSLKWNTGRADVGSWKEIPQDAKSIVEWYKKMEDLYTPIGDETPSRWNQPLIVVMLNKGRDRYDRLANQYGFDYIITETPPYQVTTIPKAMERYNQFAERSVYKNGQFMVIYAPRVKKDPVPDTDVAD